MDQSLKKEIKSVPKSPGIYKFLNNLGDVLYVGKATNLKSRVNSYFLKSADLSVAKQMMVNKIKKIETITTSSETEALILESTLIKKHKPPYNVTLKDDKNFNFIKIDYRYKFPTVATIRRPEFDIGKSKSKYFGPYTNSASLYENLRFLRRIFPFRKKAKDLSAFESELERKRSIGPIPENQKEYLEMIKRFEKTLLGKSDEIIKELQTLMIKFSKEKNYEKAALTRDQINGLKLMQSRQKMVSAKNEDQDIISFIKNENNSAINIFIVRKGKLIDKLNFWLESKNKENQKTTLGEFLMEYYSQTSNFPKEIILPFKPLLQKKDIIKIINQTNKNKYSDIKNINITIPSRGKKRKLVELGERNAMEFVSQKFASSDKNQKSLLELQKSLNLNTRIKRIEGYDISNVQGRHSVGSMVVFIDGEPAKNEYRKFKIKTVQGPDDFASLSEILQRRFNNKWPEPDIVLLDGGKGQLSAVLKSLPKVKTNKFIAIAKKKEELFQGKNLKKINLDPKSSSSKLLQRIRDEAHRFGQKYYHSCHKKSATQSALDKIPNIGPKTKKVLTQKFGSIEKIRKAEKNDIIKLIGKSRSKKLFEYL